MTFDVTAFRGHFPSLASGLAHFDGPGGTQTPAVVGQAVAATLTGQLSNRGFGTASERNADDAVRGFRSAMADLLAASPEGIVYGRSATQLTYDFSRALAKTWRAGDEVVVTELDHDANVRPWLQAARCCRGDRPLDTSRPGDGGPRPRRPRDNRQRADPAGGRHGRLQPAGHQAGGRPDRRQGT